MAAEWEIAMGMEFGTGMGDSYYSTSSAAVTATPAAYLYGCLPPATTDVGSLHIDDLLDFSNHDSFPCAAATDTHLDATATTKQSSSITGSCPLSGETFSDFQSQHSSFDLYIPQCEDAAELEWLSKFVEDSFSDVPYQCGGAGVIAPSCEGQQLRAEEWANGRGARSKPSTAAAWSSLAAPPLPPAQNSPSSSSSSSSSEFPQLKPTASGADNVSKNGGGKKGGRGGSVGVEDGVRRCTHCASEKTPQWRTGPLGPKTLCNACGVRYKSGRLVPEYRPAASPTFVLTQHSNSHRKVMELRLQKELLLGRAQENDPSSAAAAARPEVLFDDYGVC